MSSNSPFIPYNEAMPFDPMATVQSLFISAYSPYEFTNWIDESMSWKTGCMIGDWSDIHKATFVGKDVLPFMQTISGIKIDPFEVGRAKHVVCTSKKGKVIGEGILLRLSEDTFRMTGGPNFVEWAVYNLEQAAGKWDCKAEYCHNDYFVFQVQGEHSIDIIEKVCGESLRDTKYMYAHNVTICGVEVQSLRQGMSGNIGFELQGPYANGPEIYNAILEAGKEFGGVTKVGNAAKGVNHVEACFPTGTWDYTPALYDDDDELAKGFLQSMGPMGMFMQGLFCRKPWGSAENGPMDAIFSPVELGWSYSLCFDHEFPGSDILKEEKANPKRKVCTLEWNAEDVLDVHASFYREGPTYKNFVMPRDYEIAPDMILKDDAQVGISMSRAYSVYFKKMISLAVVDVEFCKPGTEVEVVWGYKGQPQKRIRATVAPVPYFNPDKKRDL